MKISTEEDIHPMTKTSYFLRLLVKLCFITIKKCDERIKFSFTKSFLYLLGSFGWFIASIILSDALELDNKLNYKVIIIY